MLTDEIKAYFYENCVSNEGKLEMCEMRKNK